MQAVIAANAARHQILELRRGSSSSVQHCCSFKGAAAPPVYTKPLLSIWSLRTAFQVFLFEDSAFSAPGSLLPQRMIGLSHPRTVFDPNSSSGSINGSPCRGAVGLHHLRTTDESAAAPLSPGVAILERIGSGRGDRSRLGEKETAWDHTMIYTYSSSVTMVGGDSFNGLALQHLYP